MKFFLFSFLVMFVLLLFHLSTKKYLNPFRLTMVFGKKGSGKSTLLTKLAYQYLRKGWHVYSTVQLPGVREFDVSNVGQYQFDENSCILIDEVGMVWDNRDYKNFKTCVRDFFKLQRHYRCRVFLFSQTFDVDKKLRDLTDEMYLVENKLRVFSYAKRILRKPCLVQPMGDAPARLDEEYKFDSILFAVFGARRLTYIPKWVPFFKSFDAPLLPCMPYDDVPFNLPKSLQRRALGRKKIRMKTKI